MRDLVTEGRRGSCMAEFWARLGGGVLHLQVCPACALVRFPPSVTCPACGVEGGEWTAFGDRGRLVAWTVTRPPAADRLPRRLRDDVPYVLGAVRFPGVEGYLLPVRVRDPRPEALEPGMDVRVRLESSPRRHLVASVVPA